MKRIFVLWAFIAGVFTCAMAQKQAEIKFDKTTIDVGTFPENKIVDAVFTFTNTGDAPLVIVQVVKSCGCMTPTFTESPVAPGKTGTIKVSYDGKNKPYGKIHKSVTVVSNAKTTPVRLFFDGNMEPPKAQ